MLAPARSRCRFVEAQKGSGEEGGVNLYGYVGNNPVDNVDPLGLSSIHVQVAVAIAKGDLVAPESLLATGMLSPIAAA